MADVDGLFKRAEEAFQKRNYDYARDLFLNILQIQPDHAKARESLRVTLIKKFQEQGATGKLKLMALRGQVEVQLKATKDSAKRIELCQKFLNDDPTNAKIRTMLSEMLLDQGHNNGSATEARMALQDDPANVGAAKTLVQAYTNLGQVKEAQMVLERVAPHVKEDRDLERLQRNLAAMQTMKAGFTDAAAGGKDGFRSALRNASQAEELEKKQHLIQTEEQLVAVIEQLEGELNENPTDAKIPKKIADLIFEKRKDYKAAQEWYRKASQLAPQDSVLRDKIEDCSLRLHDVQIETAQKANDPKLNEYKASRLKFMIQSYERRVTDRPTDMGLHFELGRSYYQAGPSYLDKAIAEFQQSVKDPKKKADSHLYLGMTFQGKKLYDMADKQYEQAEGGVLSQDKKLFIMYNRAKCCEAAGKIPKAVDIGKAIMEIDISYKDISQLVEKWENGAK